MPVCYSIMFSFYGRSVARVCSTRAQARNNISKYRDIGNWLAVRCSAEERPDRRLQQNWKADGVLLSGRIQRPGSILRTSAAWIRSPRTAPPFAIAALQTSALRPSGPTLPLGFCCPPAGRKAIADARNLLRDWRARDNAAPRADSIRRILRTTYSWPTARV
jgi:hypothetical protein